MYTTRPIYSLIVRERIMQLPRLPGVPVTAVMAADSALRPIFSEY